MKKTLTLLAFASVSMGAFALVQDSLTFVRTYKDGAKDVYDVTVVTSSVTDLSSMGQGEQTMDVTVKQTAEYTYSDLKEDGTVTVTFKYKDIDYKMEGPMAEMMGGGQEMPKEITGKAKLDKYGRMLEHKIDDQKVEGMMAMMGGSRNMDPLSNFALPKEPVTIGSEFNVEMVDLPMFEKGKTKITGKVIGKDTYKGISAYKIDSTGTMRMNMNLSEMMKQSGQEVPFNMTMEGDVKIKGTFWVEEGSNRLLKMDMATTTTANVNLSDMGMTLPVTTDTVYSVSLVTE